MPKGAHVDYHPRWHQQFRQLGARWRAARIVPLLEPRDVSSGPLVHHHLVIRKQPAAAILLVADGDAWQLPRLVTGDRHTAEVDYLNAAALERWGIAITILRCVDDVFLPERQTIVRAYDAEHHGQQRALPPGVRWCTAEELPSIRWARDADAAAVQLALAPPDGSHRGRGWTQLGWWDDACAWIGQQLVRRGAAAITHIEQLRAWEFSTVLRVDTAGGHAFFLKALPADPLREWCVTDYLAREFPGIGPSIVARDAERRWLLMDAFVGERLEVIGDMSAWERAVRIYARLQRACSTRLADLTTLGCDTVSLQHLAACIAPLIDDVAAMRPARGEPLTPAEVAHVRAAAPELHRRCQALAAIDVPLTLEHGDLWPGNILVNTAACVIIDWEDARIAHPFLSLAPLFAGLRSHPPSVDFAAVTRRLADAYVAAFANDVPQPDLHRALALAQPLAFLEIANRYRQQPASIVRLHPWMPELVPVFLRLMLRAL